MNVRHILVSLAALSLSACSGGGATPAAPPSNPGGSQAGPQSQYVTPKFLLAFPGATSSAHLRTPQFLGASSKGVTITLVSSTAGLSNVSVSTDLTASGVCSGTPKTCTVSGPPVPPGTDVFSVATYNLSPTGSPLAEPSAAVALARTGTTATPASGNPSFTIVAGTSPTLAITLFGIPGGATISTLSGTPDSAFAAPASLGVVIADAAGDAITGEFAAPVTLSDSDTSGATTVNITGGTAGPSQTLNSASDASSATLTYSGLAIASPTIGAASGAATLGSAPFTVAKSAIKLSPSEVDLYNPSPGGTGNTGTFTAAEPGWTDAPYSRTLTATPASCSSGTAASVYSLGATSGTSFTDTVPTTSPAAGVCTITIGGDLQGNTATETLTYTASSFTINGRARTTR